LLKLIGYSEDFSQKQTLPSFFFGLNKKELEKILINYPYIKNLNDLRVILKIKE
jgi:hypothetical protein